ncbi:hypothetical protein KHC27_19980 [Ancylobacter lacus]|nr:hypothetical protein [Ancylobacter lacus]MBS7541216.1 hypothetical protein [Ancylobacter lacus]
MALAVLPDPPVAEIRVVAEPRPLHRLAIDDDVFSISAISRRVAVSPKRPKPSASRTRVTARASSAERPCRCRSPSEGGHLGVAFQPVEAGEDLPLNGRIEAEPALPEAGLAGHLGGDLVALHIPAVLAFLVEAGVGIELERLAKAFIGNRRALAQPGEERVALGP